MENVKQINIKNRTYYFFNDMINIKDFDSSLLKTDKKSYKNIDIYYIGYITIKDVDDCENIYSISPLYLIVNHAIEHMEEKNKNKYLVFDLTNENKEVFKKYTALWDEIKNEIKTINGGKKGEYGKDFIKIKLNSDDDWQITKTLCNGNNY